MKIQLIAIAAGLLNTVFACDQFKQIRAPESSNSDHKPWVRKPTPKETKGDSRNTETTEVKKLECGCGHVDDWVSKNPLCAKWNGKKCVQCAPRSVMKEGGFCKEVSPQCKEWDRRSGRCTACYGGYELDDGECVQSDCSNPPDPLCVKWIGKKCLVCAPRSVNKGGKCMEVSPQCREWDSKTGKCTACYGGYELSNGECKVAPPKCKSNTHGHDSKEYSKQCQPAPKPKPKPQPSVHTPKPSVHTPKSKPAVHTPKNSQDSNKCSKANTRKHYQDSNKCSKENDDKYWRDFWYNFHY